ncbi:MAG TPA: hypothetical protein VNL18_00070 [Gemmatimonadales bacterium]|nr:hypothetical protein [Gemmatimonadales bacterium]
MPPAFPMDLGRQPKPPPSCDETRVKGRANDRGLEASWESVVEPAEHGQVQASGDGHDPVGDQPGADRRLVPLSTAQSLALESKNETPVALRHNEVEHR